MSFGRVSVETVSVFGLTKSVSGGTVCAVAVVTVAGMGGTVGEVSTDGATFTCGFLGQASATTTSASRARVVANDLIDLLIVCLLLIDDSAVDHCTGGYSITFLRPIRILVLSIERELQ